jgi:competence protein ComEA
MISPMVEQLPTTPTPSPQPPASARSTQTAILILIGISAALIGWRWIGDRTGSRPSELTHDAPVTHRVDINKANRAELMQIHGLGPARADKILSYRKTNGDFRNVDELRRIDGFGDTTIARIKPWLSVDSADDEETPAAARDEPEKLSRKSAPAPAKRSTKKPLPDTVIDVNRASASELRRLPGIGQTLAQRIVEERERRPFAKVEDLRRVSGIGATKLAEMRPFVEVSN